MTSNKKFQIVFSITGKKYLKKLDKSVQRWLLQKLEAAITSDDPMFGTAKLVNYKNIYRYRFGDYRVILAKEDNGELIILLILKVAHRRDVYNF